MSANQVNSVMPVIKLHHTLSTVETVSCSRENCKRTIKAEFQPAMCHSHRDNVAPRVGWAYITKEESQLSNTLRRRGWLVEALVEIRAQYTEISDDDVTEQLGVLPVFLDSDTASLGTPEASDAEPDAEPADMED